MSDHDHRLPVAVSSEELHDIDVAAAFETRGSFVVAVTNHGRDAHVHLKLDDDLATAATLPESNVYVERDATETVEVAVDPEETPRTGRLTVETGYGAQTAGVSVTVGRVESDDGDDGVAVDDRLADPATDDDEQLVGWLPVAGLAALALAVAGGAALLVEDPVVVAGVAVVVVGVVAAAVMLLR